MTEARIHCATYRQLAALKAVLDALGRKLATKQQEAHEQNAPAGLAALAEHEAALSAPPEGEKGVG